MALRSSLLRSAFGRRLLMLFVGCALVPIALLSVLSFRHMTRQLELQSRRRLLQAEKAFSSAIHERLQLSEEMLKSVPPSAMAVPDAKSGGSLKPPADAAASPAPQPDDRPLAVRTAFTALASRRFSALEWIDARGHRTPIVARLPAVPTLDEVEREYVGAGGTLLRAQREGGRLHVYMVRRVDSGGGHGGMFIGEVSPAFLWRTPEETLPSVTTQMAVVDIAGNVLMGTPPSVVDTASQVQDVLMGTGEGIFASTLNGERHLSAIGPVTLQTDFATPDWVLMLSESTDAVVAPMTEFRSTFFAIVLASTLAVFLLSVSQIRRSTIPLARLQEGTRRIAQRDFDIRVTVESRDEFADLADSFNAMAVRLGRQFHALATSAEIDRAVLSATDVPTIVDAVLARAGDVYPCQAASLTLIASDRIGPATTWLQGQGGAASRRSLQTEIDAITLRQLATGPEVLELELEEAPLPGCLEPMAALGITSFVVLPLTYQHQLLGVLALGNAPEVPQTSDDLLQARRLADRVAVALSNVRMIEQVRVLAYYDSLTGLLNRPSYKDRLAMAVAAAKRDRTQVAVLFVDLDNFGRINDTLGHELGDELLRQVASRLRACSADDDPGAPLDGQHAEVARLGGDEFTLLIRGITTSDQAVALARRLLAAFTPPFLLDAHEVFVTASIGIALHPGDGEDIETLLAHADTAMYAAKSQGGNGYQLFARSMNASALHRLTLESDLRRALDRGELILHYQPIVNAATNTIAGAEALVRWQHPSLGLLLPAEFVPIAEENGLIVPLGEWVLRAACAQNRAWQDAGLAPIRVVVNLSSRQLRQGTLVTTVGAALADSGLAARWLGLELTESMLMDRQHETLGALHALRSMGIQLSIDDFGTGYSSLSYLKHFPVDALKIDRSFVRDLTAVADDAAITSAIIAMAHALELKVVAEGVESEAHLSFLRSQGCDEVQGYLLGRPMPAERFAERLARGRAGGKPVRIHKSSTLAG
ncbi:MAG TPA: EAL domain-containing protein [Gemmatimonadales bacterium]|nr:EAL domain-containing protein [Gemmatimonadales bacterium]